MKEKEILEFWKAAFCIDGGVKLVSNLKDFKIESVIELKDSKRGTFYVGHMKKK